MPSDGVPAALAAAPSSRTSIQPHLAAFRRPAVVDIGSNSIRLVVYDRLSRAPFPLFNEKVSAELGRTVGETGRLNPVGATQAIESLTRFARLAQAMGAEVVEAVATAAVRDAEDGPAFLHAVEERCGLKVLAISGDREGQLSAMGVLSGLPGADGLVGDLGGGSLELARLDRGHLADRQISLPFGPLRLIAKNLGRQDLIRHIDKKLAQLPWITEAEGASFYAVGGSWRAMATLHMEQTNHPVHIIQAYTIGGSQAIDFVQLISRLSRASLESTRSISRRRVEGLPYAALVLERILRMVRPRKLVFSAYGLREGILLDRLNDETRALDPLLVAAETMARDQGRFGEISALSRFIDPLFAKSDRPALTRLRQAACLVSDIGWSEHPDYRAEHAFLRTLRLPFAGLEHNERAFLALALFIRYGGNEDAGFVQAPRRLLDPEQIEIARQVGEALRLAYTLSGGALRLLEPVSLARDGNRVAMTLPQDAAVLSRGEVVVKRLEAVANAFGASAELRIR